MCLLCRLARLCWREVLSIVCVVVVLCVAPVVCLSVSRGVGSSGRPLPSLRAGLPSRHFRIRWFRSSSVESTSAVPRKDPYCESLLKVVATPLPYSSYINIFSLTLKATGFDSLQSNSFGLSITSSLFGSWLKACMSPTRSLVSKAWFLLVYNMIYPNPTCCLLVTMETKCRPMSYQTDGGGDSTSQSEGRRRDVKFGALETACSVLTIGLSCLTFTGTQSTLILITSERL